MNIVICTRFYPPDTGGGGIASYAFYLANGLKKSGHHVRVISQMTPRSEPRGFFEGIEVFRIKSRLISLRLSRLPIAGRYLRFCNDIAYAWYARRKLLEISNETRPDIVEYADIDAEAILHPFKVAKAVIKLHTPHFVLQKFYSNREIPYDTKSVSWLEKQAILKAQGLSSPSCDLARAVAKEYEISEARITFVPNLIDSDFFSPVSDRYEPGQMILYVGRLEWRKGAVTFAQAIPQIARQFPLTRFVFLGSDRATSGGISQMRELQTLLERDGIANRVAFHGHASAEEFLNYYRRSTIFVMPSLFENCPYTLLEAMSCAKPVVVSQAYGMQEMIIDGESGLFFEPDNAMDLADKILLLMSDATLRDRLGRAARETVLERYSIETGVDKALGFYQSVLNAA